MNSTICRFCGYSTLKKLFDTVDMYGDPYEITLCLQCKAQQLMPFPDQTKLDRAYQDSYYGGNETKFLIFIENMINIIRKRRAKSVAKYLSSGANILDIGCGSGKFLSAIASYGDFNIYGTEINGKAAQRSEQNSLIQLNTAPLSMEQYPDASFDLITLIHVFEHLDNPDFMLHFFNKKIKPGGILILSMPNPESLQARLFKSRWFHLDPPRHLLLYPEKTIIAALEQRKFKLESKRYLSLEQNPFSWVQSILNCMSKKREMLFESFKGNNNYYHKSAKLTMLLHQIFFFCTIPLFTIVELFESAFHVSATYKLVFKKVDHD
ncbi:MAG: class I SAM-dependent methyltransferase [Bacteroidales bacterium]|nr:class I SAM-dependent methyltransferase [Bacteroidales bacterium]